MRARVAAVTFVSVLTLAGCGDRSPADSAADSKAVTAAPAAPPVPEQRATAELHHFSVMMDKLEDETSTFVDGIAYRVGDARIAVLEKTPLDACKRLAYVATADASASGAGATDDPVLVLIRDADNPKGAALLVEPYVRTTVEENLELMQADDKGITAKGDVGDAGWGSIDPTKYGQPKQPRIRLDVRLDYSALDLAGAAVADASADAQWLRSLVTLANAGDENAVAAAWFTPPPAADGTVEDLSYEMGSWANRAANWNPNAITVVAAAEGPDCATLVVRGMQSFDVDTALVRLKGAPGARKVASVKDLDPERSGDPSAPVETVNGRAWHPDIGSFPLLHVRVASVPGEGLVALFSDKPLASSAFEELAKTQNVLRATSSSQFGSQFNFDRYEIATPKHPAPVALASQTTFNANATEDGWVGAYLAPDDAGADQGVVVIFNAKQ